jgi:hypothetical protein
VAFPLQDASPGEYEILLRFRDELAGAALEIREPFTVVSPQPKNELEARPGGGSQGRF